MYVLSYYVHHKMESLMIACIADAYVSTWLWSMTWGLYYAPISWVIMSFFFAYSTHVRFFTAAFWSLCSILVSYILFYTYIVIILIYACGHAHVPYDISSVCSLEYTVHPLYRIIGVYTCLEFLFWRMTPLWKSISRMQLLVITLLANSVTALLIYRFFCN